MSVYQYAGNNPIMGNDPMGGQTLTRYYEDATHLHVYDNDNGAPSTANGGRAGGMDPGYEGFDVYAAGGDASAGENSTIGYGNGVEGEQTLLWFAQRGDRMAQSIFSIRYAVPANQIQNLRFRNEGGKLMIGYNYQTSSYKVGENGQIGEVTIISHTSYRVSNMGRTPGWIPFVSTGVNPVYPGATFSYPANGGAASESIFGEAATGYILTRYGGTRPNSEYFSPRGTTIGQRYLLEGTNTGIYEEFEILKPFGLEQTQIAGYNGLPTGGIQIRTSMPAGQLLTEGYIAPLETPMAPVEIPEFFIIP